MMRYCDSCVCDSCRNHASNAYMLHALGITHVVSVGECALVPPANIASDDSSSGYHLVAGKGPGGQGSLWMEEREGRIKVLDIKVSHSPLVRCDPAVPDHIVKSHIISSHTTKYRACATTVLIACSTSWRRCAIGWNERVRRAGISLCIVVLAFRGARPLRCVLFSSLDILMSSLTFHPT